MDWRRRRLYLLFTPELCRGDPWQTLTDALTAGVHLVQWRVPTPDEDGLRRCLELCTRHSVPVIVNDHVDLAVASGAAGAHVGQDDTPAADARSRLAEEQCLGVSTHSVAQATAAVNAGADHLGLGPCHPTATKGYDEALPHSVIRDVLEAVDVPVFAIGGITADRLPRLKDLGFRHFAVSSAILAADSAGGAVDRLTAHIRS